MENLMEVVRALGSRRFSVRIYDIDETLYQDEKMTYFELGTFLVTQDFVKLEIRPED